MYKVKNGESLFDVALNGCGSILAVEDILNLNGFTDWTPELLPGQELIIPPVVDVPNQSLLSQYPANNDPGVDINSLLTSFTNTLDSVTVSAHDLPAVTGPFINYYTIRNGEGILDVCLNATGTIDNWESVLNANGFTDWNPDLIPGQKIIIPSDAEIQNNVLKITSVYPSNNDPGISNFDDLVTIFIATFTHVILFTADNDLTATADSTLLTVDQNL